MNFSDRIKIGLQFEKSAPKMTRLSKLKRLAALGKKTASFVFNNRKIFTQMTLAVRLQRFFLFTATFLVIFATFVEILFRYYAEYDHLAATLDDIISLQSSNCSLNLWKFNSPELETIADATFYYANCSYFEISDNATIIVVRGEKSEAHTISRSQELTFFHNNQIVSIGTLTVQASTQRLWSSVLNGLGPRLMVEALCIIGFSLLLFLYVTRLISRRIGPISRYLAQLNTEELAKPYIRRSNASNDEIDDLLHAIEKMRLNLSDAIEQRSRTEEKFSATFEQAAVGFCHADLEGKIIRVNQKLCDISGYERQDLTSLSIFDLTNPADHDKDLENRQQLMNDQVSTFSVEKTFIRKNKQAVMVHLTVSLLRGTDGRPHAFIYVIEDITKKKQIEDALNQTQRLESIGILAGGIAHDFNNLLGGLFGFIEMCKESIIMGMHSDALASCTKAMNVFSRARDLTNQLLTFSKGGKPLKKNINLDHLVRQTTQFSLSGSQIRVEYHIARDLARCEVDENQISQVIDNLVLNARQAMPYGGTIVIIGRNLTHQDSLPLTLTKEHYISIAIKDSGIGISKEQLKRLFNPFYTTKKNGTGLGLATSYSIMMKHEGWISVDSEEGKGTTFTLYLPSNPKLNPSVAEKQKTSQSHYGSGRVLIMDDEDYIREIAKAMLTSMGYTVDCAHDGEEALTLFKRSLHNSSHYAFMVLDLTIPGGKGGREVIAAIRKQSKDVIVIASSGYSDDPVMANPHEFGFNGIINKPYRKKELCELLERIFTTVNQR
ncbi:MAG: PAS domain S-box protein [Chitinivibrionales bacterium]|nr:PAS domain S-box protein [Chitinivibrionales bacterium]